VGIGADGLIVEVHPEPEKAWSDGKQSLRIPEFAQMMQDLDPYIDLWRRSRMTKSVAAM
jgi:3-deoxy-7-phosphoheptulonate synthase